MFGKLDTKLYLGVSGETLEDLHQGSKVRAVFTIAVTSVWRKDRRRGGRGRGGKRGRRWK